MANIVGEDHLAYVKDQIKTRQEILGKKTKSSSDIVWENSTTSWVRLISSVNISDQTVLKYDETTKTDITGSDNGAEFRNEFLDLENYKGNQLSQELVLQGGTLNNTQPKFGVTNNNSNLPNSNYSYGYGGTDFGIKPMPGITAFSSKTYSQGSLRKANISILAHNKKQFDYIESTYLRLGYAMLIEWGNSNFPLSTDEYASTQDISELTLQNEFLNGFDKGVDFFYTRIENLRKKSKGNYDAFLGKVTNFSWEFTKEGSYNITLDLITIGSVIESLKINTSLDSIYYLIPPNQSNTENPTPEEDRPTALEVAIDLLTTTEIIPIDPEVNTPVTTRGTGDFQVNIKSTNKVNPIKTRLTEEEAKALKLDPTSFIESNNIISCNAAYGSETQESKHYLRLGVLLEFINKKLLVYGSNQNPSLISIDTSKDTYCYSNGYSFSGDPSKMVNRLDINLGQDEIKAFPSLPLFHTKIGEERMGQVMNLFYEKEYLKGLIKSNVNEDNYLSLYNFLNQILIDTNRLLGGVNKLKLRITEKTFTEQSFEAVGDAQFNSTLNANSTDDLSISDSLFQEATISVKEVTKQVLEIYDEVPFKKIDTNPIFNIYGFNKSEGNFVRDYQLITTLDGDFSTMISVGAQATGRAVGEDATVFSKWNVGLVDRVIPTKLDIDKAKQDNALSRVDFVKLRNTYKSYLRKLEGSEELSFSENVLPNPNSGVTTNYQGYGFPDLYLGTTGKDNPTFSKFLNVQREFFKKVLAYDAERKGVTTPFIGFLPINLSLTFDGLSGIRIFDKLTIDSRFLPKNYGETLNFIITELDHVIENNKWVTKVGTQSIPKLFDKRPEVALEDQITNSLSPNANIITDSSTPNYFYSDHPSIIGRGRADRARKVSLEEILKGVNSSPEVQDKFRKLLTYLRDTVLEGTGTEIRITSAYRNLQNSFNVYNNGFRTPQQIFNKTVRSPHFWGMALDINLFTSSEEGGRGEKIAGFGSSYLQTWRDLGIVDYAVNGLKLRWGGTFTNRDGSTYPDGVHFDAFPSTQYTWAGNSGLATSSQEFIKTAYPDLERIYTLSTQGKGIEAKVNLPYWFSDILITKDILRLNNGSAIFTTNEAKYRSSRGFSFREESNFTSTIFNV